MEIEDEIVYRVANLVHMQLGKVVSRKISCGEEAVFLYGMGKGETVSQELLLGDRVYFVVTGKLYLNCNKKQYEMNAGDFLQVAAGTDCGMTAQTDVTFFVKELKGAKKYVH